ncbi:MAG: esterase [Vitreoscilla sp.]|nr:esterase [Vitreoscilla sp.]
MGQRESKTFAAYPAEGGGQPETVTAEVRGSGWRRFILHSSQAQRDDTPQRRVVDEAPGDPQVHTGSPLFDALFAMALDDARLNSVAEIRDDAYNGGQPIACRAFQTGEKWHYVWTRDLAYAAHLALAWLDPARTAESLRFKTSDFRPGTAWPEGVPEGSLQIVQDTGSGGSWPVSTDRVSWAWGAQATLDALTGPARADFAALAYRALRGTLEADRCAAFDAGGGLYGGEQSFLDWRSQTYAPWIVRGLARMSSARALSTNVGHYQALRLGAALAGEQGEHRIAERYAAWAEALKDAINRVFWLDEVQRYSSLTSDEEHPMALHQFDLLGTALAVVSGVAPPERAALALAHYPHAPFGAPVISPQQPGVPVYHNRALWPFVTAYTLRAAAVTGQSAVAARAFESLFRGASLNLSNMENLEWLTAKPRFDDGPVINSRRQLWSVAAFLSMVVESVFGLALRAGSLHIAPFLTTAARRALGDEPRAQLSGLRLGGCAISVTLTLPPASAEPGYHPLASVRLNGEPTTGPLPLAAQGGGPLDIELCFGPVQTGDLRLTEAPAVDPLDRHAPAAFAPAAPLLQRVERRPGGTQLHWAMPADGPPQALRFKVYRNGHCVADDLEACSWLDPQLAPFGERRVYAVAAVHLGSGHHSHTSEPFCVDEWSLLVGGAGQPFALERPGRYAIELVYSNREGPLETGITNAVHWLRVLDESERLCAEGLVQMPHLDDTGAPAARGVSTAVRAVLDAGVYRVELADHFNMSHLSANAGYRGAGGLSGPCNRAQVHMISIARLPEAAGAPG